MAQSPSGNQMSADNADAHVRIKLEEDASPERDVNHGATGSDLNANNTIENQPRRIDLDDIKFAMRNRVFKQDPHNGRTGWQVLCLTKNFVRPRICGYLGFPCTSHLRDWEESNPERWAYIKAVTSPDVFKVLVADVMRIICNDGGASANVLAYMEGLDYWKWHTHVNTDFIRHTSTVATLSKTTINFAQATLRVAMTVVWLIRTSPAQFLWSGRFNTPYFWYAPEDVNCAFEYLRNLRQQPQNREREGLFPRQLAWPVKQGVDAGLASLHNSVSEGEWAGRFPRNDIVLGQKESSKEQGEQVDNQRENPDGGVLRWTLSR